MSRIITTRYFWLPFLAMLVSASATTHYLHASQDQSRQPLFAAIPSSCCLLGVTDAGLPPVPPPRRAVVRRAAVDIWARMRRDFMLHTETTDAVRAAIDEYVRHPRLLEQMLQRGEPYLFHILDRLARDGMPAELALLPVVESAFDPFATSPAGAAGIWQFMPETAEHVGLEMDWWYDGRRDILASTEAALDYLGDLRARFDGDWLLALAAYNAGSARVQRAIKHNRGAGEPVDYWHLPLPAETRAYVPRLIALKTIIARPRDYGVTLPGLPDARHFSVVEIDGQIDLRVAARLAGTTLDGLRRLNPGYDRQITAPDGTHTLLVPSSAVRLFRERIARLPAERRVESIRYRIRPGDNLSTIALVYNTTVKALRRANRLRDNRIQAGDLLIVPAPGGDALVANNDYEGLL